MKPDTYIAVQAADGSGYRLICQPDGPELPSEVGLLFGDGPDCRAIATELSAPSLVWEAKATSWDLLVEQIEGALYLQPLGGDVPTQVEEAVNRLIALAYDQPCDCKRTPDGGLVPGLSIPNGPLCSLLGRHEPPF